MSENAIYADEQKSRMFLFSTCQELLKCEFWETTPDFRMKQHKDQPMSQLRHVSSSYIANKVTTVS